jgi:hypothetical protein
MIQIKIIDKNGFWLWLYTTEDVTAVWLGIERLYPKLIHKVE